MQKLSRRSFTKNLLAASALPAALPFGNQKAQRPSGAVKVPDIVAGYSMSAEERDLATKFLAEHEKSMAPLREQMLPNEIPPSFVFASPAMQRTTGKK